MKNHRSFYFADKSIIKEIEKCGFYIISANEIKKYKEPRLMAKFDFSNTDDTIFEKDSAEVRAVLTVKADVKNIDLHSVNWNMKYDRNNKTYRMLISICYLVVNGLLQTNSEGNTKIMDFLDEQSMFRLYEKFILGYYKKHYTELSPSASRIPWSVDNTIMLPVMQSDIHLQKGNTVLIIDAKYYSHTTRVKYDNHILHSNNMYQIFTYVKNCDYAFGEEDHKVSGMLLYAKTEEEIQPDNIYQMHGNQITVKTLDLNQKFDIIAKQLDNIVKNHFDI